MQARIIAGRKSDQRQRPPEEQAGERRGPRLPQRRRQVVVLARVVVHVRRPQDSHFVMGAVEPVVDEVAGDAAGSPTTTSVGSIAQQRELRHRSEQRQVHALHDQVDQHVADAHGQAGGGVAPRVAAQARCRARTTPSAIMSPMKAGMAIDGEIERHQDLRPCCGSRARAAMSCSTRQPRAVAGTVVVNSARRRHALHGVENQCQDGVELRCGGGVRKVGARQAVDVVLVAFGDRAQMGAQLGVGARRGEELEHGGVARLGEHRPQEIEAARRRSAPRRQAGEAGLVRLGQARIEMLDGSGDERGAGREVMQLRPA